MLMLDKAVPVAVKELSKVPCPAPTESWRPYPHSEGELAHILEELGLDLRELPGSESAFLGEVLVELPLEAFHDLPPARPGVRLRFHCRHRDASFAL